jgi:hypothetical protein
MPMCFPRTRHAGKKRAVQQAFSLLQLSVPESVLRPWYGLRFQMRGRRGSLAFAHIPSLTGMFDSANLYRKFCGVEKLGTGAVTTF